MKVGILGGSFDPPHLGHLLAAEKAIKKNRLDEVWFVPYNKRNLDKGKSENPIIKSSNNLQRLEMTKLAVKGHKKFKVLDIEIKRGGVSYAIDTVLELKKKHLNYEFFWIVGEDLIPELPKWKDYKRLIKEINFIKVDNIGNREENKISSSTIKKRITKGLGIIELVTYRVEQYIKKNKLYR